MRLAILLCVVVVLSVGFQVRETEPLEVTLRNGNKLNAEILSVRDSALVLTTLVGASEEELTSRGNLVFLVRNADVAAVRTRGSSHVVLGAGLGSVAGGAMGMAIGGSQPVSESRVDFGCGPVPESSNNKLIGGSIGCVAGCLLGAAVGGASGSGSDLITERERDFKVLYQYQRYAQEPEFIKNLQS